ncbi:STY13, partial [Symbiodinium sp. KB8]
DWAQAEASDRALEEWDMMQSALESFACAWACLRLCPCWLWAFPCCTPRAFHACAGFGPSAEECDMPLLSDSAAMYLQNMLEECRDFLVPFSALEVHDLVAEGAEATVFHGLADDRPAAIKVFRAAHPGMFVDRIQEARTEARFCYTLDHPNLVKFYGLCVCPPDVALVSELCERGSLKKLLEVLHSEKRRLLARIRRSEPERSPVHSTRHSQHGAHAQAKRVSMADLYLGHKAGLGAAGQGYYGITSDTLLVYEALQLLSSDRGKALLERSRMERSPTAAARAAGAEDAAATPGQEDTRKLFEALPAWILRLSLPPLQALASNVPIFAPHGLVPIPRSAVGADGEESLSPLPRHTLEALASRSRTTVSVFNVAVPSAGAGPASEPGTGAGNKQPLLQPSVRDNYGTKDAAEGLQAEVQVAELGAANVTENDLYYVCDLRVRLGMALHAASSLAYMHSLQSDDSPQVRFVHRDIKSPNFLVTDDFTLKLTDFGEAGPLAGGRRAVPQTGGRGTLVWCAPEVFQQAGVNRYSESVDIYSLGIVLWELLTGEEPFAQYQSPHALIAAVDSGKRPRIPKHTPGVLRSLIKRMWHAQPSQRPSALTVCQLLKKFLNRLNVEVERMFWLQKRIPSRLTAEQKVSIQRLIEAVE